MAYTLENPVNRKSLFNKKDVYFKQIDKYNSRVEKSLALAGVGLMGMMAAIVMAPASPLIIAGATAATAMFGVSAAANKIAAKNTDVYEQLSGTERLGNFLSNKIKSLRQSIGSNDNSVDNSFSSRKPKM